MGTASSERLKRLVMAAMFCALAVVSMYIMRINVGFLTFDAKDAVVTLAGLLFGPIYSLVISLAVATLELISVGDTGIWGFLMDFLSTAAFSCTCSLIYKYKKNITGAVVGLLTAAISMTAAMLLFNLFIVPLYQPGMTMGAVAAMIPTLFLPFNLTKGMLNAAIVLMLYKPVSRAAHAVGALPKRRPDGTSGGGGLGFSLAVTAVGIAVAAICLVVLFVFLDGDFSLVKGR